MKCPHCGKKINVGSLMGSRRTKAKSNAARENGKKGGRPKKTPQAETPAKPANGMDEGRRTLDLANTTDAL